ncbi:MULTISPECIES: hypothetical protein [Pseudoalteromonas]|uniref:hypothetical protein n=1 Tax=Pseudoalteromonas TaxID=53246 RepID=UPI003241E41F
MLSFKQEYYLSPVEQHQQALVTNLQNDIMSEPEFKTLVNNLQVTDSGLEAVFAMSLIDLKIKQMGEHNRSNYQELVNDAVTAITVLNDEINYIVDIAKGELPVQAVMQPILAVTTFLLGASPIVRFCEDREEKELMIRVEELINSFHNTIRKSEEHNRKRH